MKTIKSYILEGSKNFRLDNSEREALSSFVGVLCGALGDDEDQDIYKVIIDSLTDTEIEQLDNLYDCLDDIHTYKTINRSVIADDITLINKIYTIANENDLLNEQWDLIDALEKIVL